MRKPYSVRLFPFDLTSGGIRVMWGLMGALLLKGEEVIANAVFNESSIGIYPEIMSGNELRSSTVVRYILNKPGVMSYMGQESPTSFLATDLQFVFSKMFAPDTPEDRLMFLPIINTEVFYDKKKKRNKKALFVGKGSIKELHEDCVPIDRELARDQEKLADLLNECQCLYSYDPVSAMSEIARLCGCPVVYLSNTYSENDYKLYEPGTLGMSFDGTIHEFDSEAFKRHYNGLKDHFYNIQLPNFIKVTQNA